MSSALPPLSIRRANAQRRATQQRAAIAEAWAEFERHELRGERRVRQVIALTRRLAGLSALLAAGLAVRRAASGLSPRRIVWRGFARPLLWFGLVRKMMRRKGDGPGVEGNRL